jgi:hypothetical protein
MNMQQTLESLIQEVESMLGNGKIHPKRQPYYEGAHDYLLLLKELAVEGSEVKRPVRVKEPKPSAATPKPGSSADQ